MQYPGERKPPLEPSGFRIFLPKLSCALIKNQFTLFLVQNLVLYMTLDFTRAASQNGFGIYKLSLHKKKQYYSENAKDIKIFFTFISYHIAVIKQDHYKAHLFSYAKTVF